ncbi:DUF998 domain-containing protein [Rhizobium leguminosarum]|uniref:DUF998 domain-containing protein n=1 Tax=Rhizobium leguminosarum TaxID=384 RepID=UPI001030BE89|nr:DUF998 domain-containing protein [Rhizobium leguminosarum]TAU90816.1 DUF998 domain-containing protein [Rhizobium leguminosarum]TAV55475.1 DUF998 domain-containing protein [Rhizobium leguminosarum]TAX57716.1 DUF998 domain-containing protein [Rhizobium leguminosarum]TAX62057.1 DUF998 domain-containing protein [Rhizobium leguminosarum]TAY03586.1 DUF998 domain-containing protein [Rhizobium leguminosarum]
MTDTQRAPQSDALLACGVMLAPVFYAIVLAQLLTRTGFDITKHPLSLLSLGQTGWIQVANFLLAGIFAIACAVGVRKRLSGSYGGTLGPFFIATFGLGMIVAGFSKPDPLLGFPPGSADGIPEHMSGHAVGHGIGFFVAFVSLIAACFMFGRRFSLVGRPWWSVYSNATGALTILLIAMGMAVQSATSLAFFLVGIVAFGWLGAVSWHLMAQDGK